MQHRLYRRRRGQLRNKLFDGRGDERSKQFLADVLQCLLYLRPDVFALLSAPEYARRYRIAELPWKSIGCVSEILLKLILKGLAIQ